MATHQLELPDDVERALVILEAKYNEPLLLQKPPGNVLTGDDFLLYLLAPTMASWIPQANVIVEQPIIEQLRKVIASGKPEKLQTVIDAVAAQAALVAVDAGEIQVKK